MSHFTVLVPADDVNDLEDRLLPFMENCCGTPPYDYMTFFDEEDRLQDKGKEIIVADSYAGEKNPESVGKTHLQFFGQGDFDKFCEEWAGLSRDPLEGRIGYWQNEDAKWDWYSVGGRWTGYLQLKQQVTPADVARDIVGYGRPGVFGKPQRGPLCCDWAPVSWIDWKGMRDKDFEEALEHFRTFKKCQAEAEAMDVQAHLDEFRVDFLKLLEEREDWQGTLHEYTEQRLLGDILRREKIFLWGQDDLLALSEEEFILKQKAKALTFAFVDMEGRWVQRGQMGWWALVSDKNEGYDATFWLFVKRLEESSPNQRCYLVDCHI